jgi:hypothetical protein
VPEKIIDNNNSDVMMTKWQVIRRAEHAVNIGELINLYRVQESAP